MMDIRVELTKTPKEKPTDHTKLGFGDIFTDHMFLMNYKKGKGWYDPRIVPYGPLQLDPAAMILHYAQEVFEGMKAYCCEDGMIRLFRPQENFKRLNASNSHVCIPPVDEELVLEGLKKLIEIEKDWVPTAENTSLYIRPFIIATDAHLGVRPSNEYLFVIILSPVGAYYKEGLNPVKIYVETNYVRAVRGGLGMCKTSGNYAASLKAQVVANEQNYTQVLWLDGVERKYIEEVGTMNVFFKIGDEVVTPELRGSILPGITRKSTVELLKHWGYNVSERLISIQEVADAAKNGKLVEAFGTGTAAVISPIGHMKWGDIIMDINNGEIGELSQKLYDTITGIQWGRIKDPFGWSVDVCKK